MAVFPISSGFLAHQDGGAGLPSSREEKSNLPQASRGFFSHLNVHLKFSSSFLLAQKLCRVSVSFCLITLLILVMGLLRQLVTK